MQPTTFAIVAFSTFVYISSTLTAVYGYRCTGRWAIHACYGGNGKRSGPPSSLEPSDSDDKDRQYILRQLLLSDKLSPSFPATNDIVVDSGNVAPDVDSLYPDVDAFSRSKDIEKARTLLGELLLQRRFRNTLSSDLVYKR